MMQATENEKQEPMCLFYGYMTKERKKEVLTKNKNKQTNNEKERRRTTTLQ